VFGSGASTRVYCCNYFDGTVTVLDPAQPASPVVAVIPVGEGPIDLVRDGTLLYVANSVSGGIAVIDTTTNTKLPTELLLP
jgi:YVTN family beta-propeller protein